MEDLAQVGILLFKFRIDEPLGRCAQRPQNLFHCIERRPPLTSFQCGDMPHGKPDLFRKLFARHILPLAQFFQFFTETLL